MTTVYIVSFYANITKIAWNTLLSLQIYSIMTKKVMLLYKEIILIRCCRWIFSRVLNTVITDKIVTIKIIVLKGLERDSRSNPSNFGVF